MATSEVIAAFNIVLWTLYYLAPFAGALVMHTYVLSRKWDGRSIAYVVLFLAAAAASVPAGVGIALTYNVDTTTSADSMMWHAAVIIALLVPLFEWWFVLQVFPAKQNPDKSAEDLLGLGLATALAVVDFSLLFALKGADVLGNFVPGGMVVPLAAILVALTILRAYPYYKGSFAVV
jgi:hypothetical protein